MPGVKTKYAVNEMLDNVRLGKKVSFGGPYALFHIYDVLVGKAPRSLFLLKKDIVLKHLFPNSASKGEDLLKRIKESIRALSCIQHPAFLELEGGIIDGQDHIAFLTEPVKSCCAEPLKETPSFILSELLILADGIAHIQNNGRAFLDITPASVVLTSNNHLKFCSCSCLLPLPLARPIESHPDNIAVMNGTPLTTQVCVIPKEEIGMLPTWSPPEMKFQNCYSQYSDSFCLASLSLLLFGLKGLWSVEPLVNGPSHNESYSTAISWKCYIVNPDRPEDREGIINKYNEVLGPYAELSKIKTDELLDTNDIIPKSIVPTNIATCIARSLSPIVSQRPTIDYFRKVLSSPQAKLSLLLTHGPYISKEERNAFFSDPSTKIVAHSFDDIYIRDVILPRMAECTTITDGDTGNIASLYIYSLLTLLHKVDMPMIDIVFGEWSKEEVENASTILLRLRGSIACIISASSSMKLENRYTPFCMQLVEIIPLLYKTVYEECGKPLLFWAMTNSTPKITTATCRMILKFHSWCKQREHIIHSLGYQNYGYKDSEAKDVSQVSMIDERSIHNYIFVKKLIDDILLIILSEKFIPETLNPVLQIEGYNKYIRNRILLVGTFAEFGLKEDITLFLQNMISNNEYYDIYTYQTLLWLIYKTSPLLDIKIHLISVIPFITQLILRFNESENLGMIKKAFSLLCSIGSDVMRKVKSLERQNSGDGNNYTDDQGSILKISTPCLSIVPKSNNPDLEVFVKAVLPDQGAPKRKILSSVKSKLSALSTKSTESARGATGEDTSKKQTDPVVQSINDLLSF